MSVCNVLWQIHVDHWVAFSSFNMYICIPLQLLSLREKSGDSGHDVGHQSSSLSLSTSSRPFSYTTTLGGYSSLSSTLPPYPSSSLSLRPLPVSSLSTASLPPTSSPSLEPFKLTFSLPSAAGSDQTALPSSITSSPDPSLAVNTDETTGTCTCVHAYQNWFAYRL